MTKEAILVTGASSGIGEQCARTLSQAGHVVVLVARNAERLCEIQQSLPNASYVFPYDLEELGNIKSIFDFCKASELCLTGLIHSAGVNADCPIKACSVALMERVMRVNCLSFIEMGKYFSNKRYTADHARMVAISSSASLSCDKGMCLYSASKAALNAAVKTMSREFTRRGILVNAILPAGVLTPMAVKKLESLQDVSIDEKALLHEIESSAGQVFEGDEQPFGFITPGCIADIATYLVSQRNRYVTGALIPVSAGRVF